MGHCIEKSRFMTRLRIQCGANSGQSATSRARHLVDSEISQLFRKEVFHIALFCRTCASPEVFPWIQQEPAVGSRPGPFSLGSWQSPPAVFGALRPSVLVPSCLATQVGCDSFELAPPIEYLALFVSYLRGDEL
jgi:hypothetical protein